MDRQGHLSFDRKGNALSVFSFLKPFKLYKGYLKNWNTMLFSDKHI